MTDKLVRALVFWLFVVPVVGVFSVATWLLFLKPFLIGRFG